MILDGRQDIRIRKRQIKRRIALEVSHMVAVKLFQNI